MVNAWSLAHSILNGTFDEDYPIMTDDNRITPEESDEYDPITGIGNTAVDDSWVYESPDGGKTVYRYERGTDPLKRELYKSPDTSKKYQEDKSLKDLTDYVNTTYEGHYTSDKGDNVQTLDIIESVGDAKSFCRSNAIKYLTRYEKKGQAKRDILKAAHYCLLLYYFDGHTNTN